MSFYESSEPALSDTYKQIEKLFPKQFTFFYDIFLLRHRAIITTHYAIEQQQKIKRVFKYIALMLHFIQRLLSIIFILASLFLDGKVLLICSNKKDFRWSGTGIENILI